MERRGGEQPGLEDAWSAGSLAAAAPPQWVGAPSWESLSREDRALRVVGGGWRHGEEGEDAAEPYREFLASGSHDYPIELLRGAGVDMTTADPIEAAFSAYDEALDEFADLT